VRAPPGVLGNQDHYVLFVLLSDRDINTVITTGNLTIDPFTPSYAQAERALRSARRGAELDYRRTTVADHLWNGLGDTWQEYLTRNL
jgi:hypothetical protein